MKEMKEMEDDEIEIENKIIQDDIKKKSEKTNKEDDKSNWYLEQYAKRYAAIKQSGEQRNADKKKFTQSSEKYDSLKRSFYNITAVAVDEGVITEHDREAYKSKIKKMDRELLEDMKIQEKKVLPSQLQCT